MLDGDVDILVCPVDCVERWRSKAEALSTGKAEGRGSIYLNVGFPLFILFNRFLESWM